MALKQQEVLQEVDKHRSAKLILELINTSVQGDMIKAVYRSALKDLYDIESNTRAVTGESFFRD